MVVVLEEVVEVVGLVEVGPDLNPNCLTFWWSF